MSQVAVLVSQVVFGVHQLVYVCVFCFYFSSSILIWQSSIYIITGWGPHCEKRISDSNPNVTVKKYSVPGEMAHAISWVTDQPRAAEPRGRNERFAAAQPDLRLNLPPTRWAAFGK